MRFNVDYDAITNEVCARHGLNRATVLESPRKILSARLELIGRLLAAGAKQIAIARWLNCSDSSVTKAVQASKAEAEAA